MWRASWVSNILHQDVLYSNLSSSNGTLRLEVHTTTYEESIARIEIRSKRTDMLKSRCGMLGDFVADAVSQTRDVCEIA